MEPHLLMGNCLIKYGIISLNGQRDVLIGKKIKAESLCTQQGKSTVIHSKPGVRNPSISMLLPQHSKEVISKSHMMKCKPNELQRQPVHFLHWKCLWLWNIHLYNASCLDPSCIEPAIEISSDSPPATHMHVHTWLLFTQMHHRVQMSFVTYDAREAESRETGHCLC